MKQFASEQMIDFLRDYTSQSELEDKEINCMAVNSFLHRHKMRAIKRDKHFDYVFYSTDGEYRVNFSLDNDSLNRNDIKDTLESFYSQKD